jgi:xanthine dehydrogenase accessory factor
METADHEVLRTAAEWLEAGTEVYLATVARTFGSSPRPPGSIAALRGDGHFVGSLSGGCIEYDLAARIREQRLGPSFPATVRYGITREEAMRFGLPCGGKLELLVERLEAAAPLREVLARMDAGRLVLRQVCLATGESSLHVPGNADEFSIDEFNLRKVIGPRWRLVLIGAGQLSRFAAEFAQALDYEVFVCEPREEMARDWRVPGTTLDPRMPDDAVHALAHERCAVLALMHDPKLDDLALLEALAGPACYVGALGSQANSDKRCARLASLGVTPAQLARLHAPVGLPIGSKTPAEIALAALAGVTAARHGATLATTATLAVPRSVRV